MALKLIVGDLVKLKSGGPWTTVTKDRPEQGSKFVQVSWFDGSALRSEVLPKEALEAKEPREVSKEPKPAASE
jgi:uncharacterized protein YodC (DUF2158 family)